MTAQQKMLLGTLDDDIRGCSNRLQSLLVRTQRLASPNVLDLAQIGADARKLAELSVSLAYWIGVISGQEDTGSPSAS